MVRNVWFLMLLAWKMGSSKVVVASCTPRNAGAEAWQISGGIDQSLHVRPIGQLGNHGLDDAIDQVFVDIGVGTAGLRLEIEDVVLRHGAGPIDDLSLARSASASAFGSRKTSLGSILRVWLGSAAFSAGAPASGATAAGLSTAGLSTPGFVGTPGVVDLDGLDFDDDSLSFFESGCWACAAIVDESARLKHQQNRMPCPRGLPSPPREKHVEHVAKPRQETLETILCETGLDAIPWAGTPYSRPLVELMVALA